MTTTHKAVAVIVTLCSYACVQASPVDGPVCATPSVVPVFVPQTITPLPPMTLEGVVTVSPGIKALNTRDGLITGGAVRVLDVLTGDEVAQGVTYYDGSYSIDIPHTVGNLPVLVSVDIEASTTVPIQASLTLDLALSTQTRNLSVRTTSWLALLTRLASRQVDQNNIWPSISIGAVSLTLAEMIKGSDPVAEDAFEGIVDPSIDSQTTTTGLADAIRAQAASIVP